ncbi:hypothetical protein RvY_09271 [Ramazzottius varieornatus]|uniref:CCZ1/INTU/HSP4 first Longin domain-containing protein n=1 Tax=Ramazzottius varieornatus TaxID=947166 RepID=A0A1D1VB87_RAMVA|nr:hypothetical protein RvY_09271 [Ramazzottius varieornatus]
MSSSKEKLSSPSPHGHHHSHGYNSRSVEVDLASFCIFNSTLGPKEGEESKKILLYFPSDVIMDAQIRHVGLLEAVTKFVSSFSDKNCGSMQTSQQLHVTYQPEEDFWMAMVTGNDSNFHLVLCSIGSVPDRCLYLIMLL